jgi:glycosyltransferase involved in cell wall biosynthesis
MQVSFCIATHHNPEGLYLSVYAALQQLEKSSIDWEILIVADGGTPDKWEQAHPNIRCIRLTGSNSTGSPQGTRDVGIRAAKYKNVICIDSHVIVSDIEKWVAEHERLHAAISFPAMVGVCSEFFKYYGNKMDFDNKFWNVRAYDKLPDSGNQPFRVCQCAHSGLLIDRDWYIRDGGYTLEQHGYGGEEPFLALLAWMMGESVWFIPQVWHAHYQPPNRNVGAGQTDDFARNFMIAAFVIGGQEYLNIVQRNFTWAPQLKMNPEIWRRRQAVCKGPYGGDLNALREYFKREKVIGGY